jgi:tetratricopeptide (TPR) repeat protein
MSPRVMALCASMVFICGITAALWWHAGSSQPDYAARGAAPPGETPPGELPIPPFPPRIAEGDDYEACLATLVVDRAGSAAIAEATQTEGDGALHCRGLALIAVGQPARGAELLEQLAQQSSAPALARASVLGQAGQARLMVAQAGQAAEDASLALKLSPADTELFILRATAEGMLGRFQDAVDDLTRALELDVARPDALVARAVMHRNLDHLDQAQADVSQALTLDPDDPDALLERGILRQRLGDWAGARSDWEHARGVDPNSTTADLAAQNLSLLEAGPHQ